MTNNVPAIRLIEYREAWKQNRLGNLAFIVRGASPRPIQDSKWFNSASDVGWLRISDVTYQNGRITYLDQKLSEEGQKKTRVLLEPHLLLSIAATVGKPVINYVKTGVHDGFLIFQNPSFDKEFMFQWLEMFRPKWKKYGQPGSQVNLNSELVQNQEIFVPEFDEQKKIGSFFKNLDDTISLHQQELEALKQTKQGFLQKMFPQNEETVPEFRFGGFSEGWSKEKLANLADFSKGSGYSKGDLITEGTPILLYGQLYTNYKSIISSVSNYVSEKEKSVISAGNEVVVPASGESSEDIARASAITVPGIIIGGDLNIIRPTNKVEPIFLALALSNGKVQRELSKFAQGKSVVHLQNSEIKKVQLLFPEIEEQIKIGEFFRQLDEVIELKEKEIEALKETKKGFLQKMFV